MSDDDGHIRFNRSCPCCQEFLPLMVATDPDTGSPIGLYGDCMVKYDVNGCPAAKTHGVKVGIMHHRPAMNEGRAVEFTTGDDLIVGERE